MQPSHLPWTGLTVPVAYIAPKYVRYPNNGHFVVQHECQIHSVANDTGNSVICEVIHPSKGFILRRMFIPAYSVAAFGVIGSDVFLDPGTIITTYVVDTKTGRLGRSYKFTPNNIVLQEFH